MILTLRIRGATPDVILGYPPVILPGKASTQGGFVGFQDNRGLTPPPRPTVARDCVPGGS